MRQRRFNLRPTSLACAVALLTGMAPLALPAPYDPPRAIELSLRTRDKEGRPVAQAEAVDPRKVAVIVIDPWNYHWCLTAAERVGALVPRLNRALECARRLGMTVVWAPTDVAGMYAGTPQRERALAVRPLPVPKVLPELTCTFSVPGNHCMCGPGHPCTPNYGWDGMHPGIAVARDDLICCGTQETYSNLKERGITHVLYMGFHTNVCVFGKPEAIRYLHGAGLTCVLARDITDAITQYLPDQGFTPDYGTRRVIEDLERAGLPTVDMAQEMRKAKVWKDDWVVDPVRLAPWGTAQRPYVFEERTVVALTLPLTEGAEIRSTLDGSEPKADSALYTRPLKVERTTQLRALGFRGGKAVSLPAKATLVRLPPRPPMPDVAVGELKPVPRQYPHLDCFWLPKVNRSYEGKPLQVRGRRYAAGLGMRAPANELYELKPEYERFVALAGVDDNRVSEDMGRSVAMHASLVFQVFVDGELAAESPVVRTGQEPWRFDVKLPRVARRINLVTADAGSRSPYDLGNWVNAGFVLRGAGVGR
jgi:nicotinamidase-related amidase